MEEKTDRIMLKCCGESLRKTAETLLAGGVAVIPTDTVYGLAAHPAFPQAVARLYTIKSRELAKPIALLAADADAVSKAGFRLEGAAKALADAFWPGGLTMILGRNAHPEGSPLSDCEGFRVPDHEWTRRLLAACGGVLRVTSANISGAKAATDALEALSSVGLSADIAVDGGPSRAGIASTVVRFEGGRPVVLRQGGVDVSGFL